MAPPELLIACVGKPSAGKSSFLNAITNARAKVGNYPFTTIEPNTGVAHHVVDCACARVKMSSACRPRYGRCVAGRRWIPVKVLDVAGLVPGAAQGCGLGNQFLNDLRLAHVLIHVVDVSGTTDEAGKETLGYDPVNDVNWLTAELRDWILQNLRRNWSAVVRKGTLAALSLDKNLLRQFSGYGAGPALCARVVQALPAQLRAKSLDAWDDADVCQLVDEFLSLRFPTIIALNKIDLPDADKNINNIFKRYPEQAAMQRIVTVSALAEKFLRTLHQANFIHYIPGTDRVYTASDPPPPEEAAENELKEADEKTRVRLDKVVDMVLFRYGSTGCQEVVTRAVEAAQMVPVYPVRSVHSFGPMQGYNDAMATDDQHQHRAVFEDCYLVRAGTSMGSLARMLFSQSQVERGGMIVETVGGRQLGEEDCVQSDGTNCILAFKFGRAHSDAP